LLSHQRKGEKEKRVWRQVHEWLSVAVAHLPAAVSLLLLEALFMQISGVSLTLTWPYRLCLLRVLLGSIATATSFPLSKHTVGGDTAPAFSGQHVYLQFMWEVGLPLSSVEFSSHRHFYKLSRSWLLDVCYCSCLLWMACLFTVLWGIAPSPLLHSECPALFAMCLFCCYCLLFSFSFFPGWGSVCPGGYADLAQGCLWEYRVPLSSPCGLCLPKPSGCWHLATAQEPSWFLCLT
jgi:hypothetical protein